MAQTREIVEKALEKGNGVLNLVPAWVARDFLPPGRRLGLTEKEYDAGVRGCICERWLASVTKADNAVGPADEGLSYLNTDSGEEVSLRDAVAAAGDLVMGAQYAKTHSGLGRLAKIYDFGARIPYHIHQMEKDAKLVGANSKDEAYYFPEDVPTGPQPETFFGVHPYIVDEKKYDILLPYLVDWKDDLILQHASAYLNVPGEGFILPSGLLHAPGTALTIELQEDSDVFSMLQALNAGKIISKELLFKDVSKAERDKKGERAILDQLDWPANGDPYFYENHHLPNIFVEESRQTGGEEHWIYYNTPKFSGKRLVVKPGQSFTFTEKGVFNILVWRGSGT
ncbi:MAG: hypothetical protein WCJ54_06855, partial [Actinomycetota bacterium]